MYIYVASMSFHNLIAHFFLELNNIPLSGYNSLFTHLPTKGYVCCVQVLAIMNKVIVNI